jgi:hypothetical protein
MLYFFSLKICAILTGWTNIFDFGFALLSVNLFYKEKKLMAALFYGIALYLNPIHLMILTSFLLASDYKNSKLNKKDIFSLIFLSLTISSILVYFSFLVTGNSWVKIR